MRDIKQYFANGTKVDDVIVDPDNVVEQREEQEKTVSNGSRKRRRVKIRISRNGSKERTCDIVESKSDLIDKTPSPFAKVNDGVKIPQDETPKTRLTSLSAEQYIKKDSKLAAEMSASKSRKAKNILQNMSSESGADKHELNKEIVLDLDDSSNDNVKNVNDGSASNAKFHDNIGSQREESNAFQVLMNRVKPILYKSPPQQPVGDAESKEKSSDAKELRLKRKEKLIALADKKGYSEKKLAEAEEGERIEKNIEKRIKFFKYDDGRDDNTGLSIKNNKQLSGNLLDYFSKSPVESTNKDAKCMSTFIVKADVHMSETSDVEPILKPIPNKIYFSRKCSKPDLNLSNIDDIHIIASENLIPPHTVKQDRQQREKPRWSLRIKLNSSETNDSWNDSTDDELFSPRSKSKFNASSNKFQKSVNMCIEEDIVRSKNYNGCIKTKMRDKEKNEPHGKQKNSKVQTYSAKDVIVDDENDYCNSHSQRSDEASIMEERFNGASETIITDDSECEIISENILKRKSIERLAPLFTKRRKTDPVAVAARRLFLQSDITDVENKDTDKKIYNSIPRLPFPTISHVTQLENKPDLTRSEISHKFPMRVEKKYVPLIDISKYECITNYNEAPKANEAVNKPVKGNLDRVLSEIGERCPDAQKIWKTVSTIKGKSEKKSPSRVRGKKVKSLERKGTLTGSQGVKESQLHDCTWTCKYKPMSAQEVVGNEEAARKLKDWLSGWRASLTKENALDDSSGDEFYSSDCSISYNIENNQIAILLGPHGSGKSASVYAIAEELGYSVLEVNASSRRTGKRILKELEEATKSHRIKKNKDKLSFEQVAKENEAPRISQNSLILLEDIDLIFEEDEGFVSAAYQLASNTKRPIVMTCRDTCPHLSKMAPQQNKIYFQKVNGSRVFALLELISLAETGYRLSHNCLMKLLQAGDLRKALLQLQYLLLSGPPILSKQSTTLRPSLWQDMQRYLYKPAIKLNRRHKTRKDKSTKKSVKQADNTAGMLDSLADDLDNLSLVSSLIDVEDTALNMSETNTQSNLSLAEKLSLYSAARHFSTDVAAFISDAILYKDLSENEPVQNQSRILLRKQLNQGVDLALSRVTSACSNRRIMAIDYLPTVRTICRAEESRCTVNHKRGNRFFHYLHGLKVPTASMKPNILAAACRTLQERVDRNASTSNM